MCSIEGLRHDLWKNKQKRMKIIFLKNQIACRIQTFFVIVLMYGKYKLVQIVTPQGSQFYKKVCSQNFIYQHLNLNQEARKKCYNI